MAFQLSRYSGGFDAMRSLQRELERGWWERSPFADRFGLSAGDVFPGVNIFEKSSDELVLLAELPGVRKEDVKINVRRDVVTLEGQRVAYPDNEDKKRSFLRRERDEGAFNRSFRLPFPVDPDRVTARMEDGMLSLSMVKAEEARAREIPVSS